MGTENGTVINNTAIVRRDREPAAIMARTGAELERPTTYEQVWELAKNLAKSGIVPSAVRGKADDIAVILLTGLELGLTPMKALRAIHVIEGRPGMSAELLVAMVKASPVCEYFVLVESDATRATYETKRVGEPKPTRLTFTIAEAQHLMNRPNWKLYPAAMLRARASSALARAVYPDLVLGLVEVDELDDIAATEASRREPTFSPPPAPPKAEPRVVEATIAEVTRPMTQPSPQAAPEQKLAPARQRRARTPVNPSTPTGPVEPDPHGTMPDAAIPPAASEPPKTETQGLADQGVVDEPPDDYSAASEPKPNTLLDVASDGFARPSKVDSLAMKIAQARTADVLEDLAIEVSGADAINEITRDQAIQLAQMIADRKAEDPEIVLDRIQRALDEETLGRIKASVTPRLKFFTAEHLKAFSAAQAKRRAEIKAGRVGGAHKADGDR